MKLSRSDSFSFRLVPVAMTAVILFLFCWTFVEYFASLKDDRSAPAGTTFTTASDAGATVSPSRPGLTESGTQIAR